MLNKNLFETILEITDSYKITHWKQIPTTTSYVHSYFESRSKNVDELMFYGLQYYLHYLKGSVITPESIPFMMELSRMHLGNAQYFNKAMFEYIIKKHNGCLPIEICAVPEGTILPTQNVLMTVVNTDPSIAPMVSPIVNWTEPLLSMIWYPCTVATRDREMKKVILKYLIKTGDPNLINLKLVDFGLRGSTSPESAAIGGSAHLVNFEVTDNIPGMSLARRIYKEPMAGYSIPAAEHFTITVWGRNREAMAYRNMLKQFPNGYVAVVSDSYNVFHATKNLWGGELKAEVISRDGTLVVRPDSGNPVKVVLKILNILGEKFGFSINNKGYKVLDPHVRVIQGDGIDPVMLEKILSSMDKAGWSADNITFGSGGGLLQKDIHRDVYKFAFKCSAACIDGVWNDDISKDPITDPGKKSKAGRLKLINDGNGYKTVKLEDSPLPNLLIPVFRNGEILKEYTFAEIRERAKLIY